MHKRQRHDDEWLERGRALGVEAWSLYVEARMRLWRMRLGWVWSRYFRRREFWQEDVLYARPLIIGER